MNFLRNIGIVLTLTLLLIGAGVAEEVTNGNTVDEQSWTGTWTDVNYSISIEQNESVIKGIATPFDIKLDDPFRLDGMISEDGKKLIGAITETGTLEMYLSDDQTSFTANGTVDPLDSIGEALTYTTNGTRNGTSIIPENIWSGEWVTINSSIHLNQSGKSVTGEYYPIKAPKLKGIFEGTVSDDGKTLSTVWSISENVDFIQSDDGMYLIELECGEEEIAAGEVCFNLTRTV